VSNYKKKLIEVALPLEAINRESAREKSIRHGHPSTLHLWWARRPLAACRAVLFSQLVDDPSAHPDKFPTVEAQAIERQRLFDIIERLVVWENINDKALIAEAHEEILKSTNGNPPTILDPFAGGGSIPLEALRLGLEAHASDLNPVAVLINKALIEIPSKWVGQPPTFPGAADAKMTWPKATGLAEDIKYYGQWAFDEAEKRIGHLYPKATLSDGTEANVIAWIWARTVACPNPACGIEMPLVRSWWLGKKKVKEAYVVPRVVTDLIGNQVVEFTIGHDLENAPTVSKDGTIQRGNAVCLACKATVPKAYIKSQGMESRIGSTLMALAAEGKGRRYYLPANALHVEAAKVSAPQDVPDTELSTHPQYMGTPRYGLVRQSDLFTPRQLIALSTFSNLVGEVRERLLEDALAAGLNNDGISLEDGGEGATAHADAISIYLTLIVGKCADYWSAVCSWHNSGEKIRNTFGRQAISMVWDFAEANPFSASSGNYIAMRNWLVKVIAQVPVGASKVEQRDATNRDFADVLVSTDPPYYDNVPYADLSDFFYGWLRKSLLPVLPSLFETILTPKSDELVADQVRKGGRQAASDYFELGFRNVFANIRQDTPIDFPITVFYAFKQVEDDAAGRSSTGWQSLLEGMLQSNWEVTATWPMRTELGNRMRGLDSNALASSIVLALRPRAESAETISRRGFVQAMKNELPSALKDLQQSFIAPVDLAQAAIGPGMSVFSRYARVLEADGTDMTVRTALALINQVLGEVLSDQEGDFDAETRFAVQWFTDNGWNDGTSGSADVLSRALNTTIGMLERGGIFRAAAGKARLLEPADMSTEWSPADDKAISVWEVTVRLGYALQTDGLDRAAAWMREASSRVDMDAVKELSYLMYSVCERKGWSESAMLFNALGTSWGDVAGAARAFVPSVSQQSALEFGSEDE